MQESSAKASSAVTAVRRGPIRHSRPHLGINIAWGHKSPVSTTAAYRQHNQQQPLMPAPPSPVASLTWIFDTTNGRTYTRLTISRALILALLFMLPGLPLMFRNYIISTRADLPILFQIFSNYGYFNFFFLPT